MTDGYTGTALAQQLGLKRGVRAWFCGMPDSIRAALDLERLGVDEMDTASAGLEHVHLFCTERVALEHQLEAVRALIDPSAFVWVSWRPNAEGGHSAPTADVIRAVAAPLGLVDVEERGIDAEWSGLKLRVQQSLR